MVNIVVISNIALPFVMLTSFLAEIARGDK